MQKLKLIQRLHQLHLLMTIKVINGVRYKTDEDGYYKVEASADKHDKQGNYCYVNPGKTETLTFNLSYQAISI